MAPRNGVCLMCGDWGTLTVEDALPKWIGRAFADRQPNPGIWTRHRIIGRPGQPEHRHSRPVGNPSAYKLPLICDRCNGGWMRELENEVKPFLEPMIFGEFGPDEMSLDTTQMDALA